MGLMKVHLEFIRPNQTEQRGRTDRMSSCAGDVSQIKRTIVQYPEIFGHQLHRE